MALIVTRFLKDPKSLPPGLPASLMNMINKSVAASGSAKLNDAVKASVTKVETETPAQKQAAAKLALRKQLEKTLLQVRIYFFNRGRRGGGLLCLSSSSALHFFPIILFLSTTLLTGMTSLHMQWPLTSHPHGSRKKLFLLKITTFVLKGKKVFFAPKSDHNIGPGFGWRSKATFSYQVQFCALKERIFRRENDAK
jgi:hypothetical protein